MRTEVDLDFRPNLTMKEALLHQIVSNPLKHCRVRTMTICLRAPRAYEYFSALSLDGCGRLESMRLAKQMPNRGYPTDYILYEYVILSGLNGTVVFGFLEHLQICSFALAAA